MRITTAATIILSLVLIFELAILTQRTSSFPVPDSETIPVPIITNPVSAITESQTPSPNPTDNPKPTTTPGEMREFNTMQKGDMILAFDPPSYVTPGNAWVKWQASQLYLDKNGYIKYKNTPEPWMVDGKTGEVLAWTDKVFLNNYSFRIYGTNVDKNNVPWLMPDYYITHGRTGVCSAWANTVTSLMLSGEMSVYQYGVLKKQVIPAKTVAGHVGGSHDAWTEYKAYGKVWITSTSLASNPDGEVVSSTAYRELAKTDNQFKPEFEWDDKSFREYQ